MTVTKAKEILEDSFTVINTHGLYTADEEIEAQEMAIEALKLIPDNATNGEMIQALFPNGAVAVMSYPSNKIGFITRDGNPDDNYVWYPTSWWNAPYKMECTVQKREGDEE